MAFTGVSPVLSNDAVTSTLSTPGSSATTIATLSIATGSCGVVQCYISGKDNSLNVYAGQFTIGYKNSAGTAAVVGVLNSVSFTDAALTTCAVTAVASGANILIKVAGVAATDIQWQSMISLYVN